MCMIVDASKLGDFLADPIKMDSEPIHKWLERGMGILVYSTGGQYGVELNKAPKLKDKLADYARSGRARVIRAERFEADELALTARSDRRSNDAHVLALARESGARVLYTGDDALMADFKDKKFIDGPRGKIYSSAANRGLLTRDVCAKS